MKLAFILARQGGKRIPQKNTRDFDWNQKIDIFRRYG